METKHEKTFDQSKHSLNCAPVMSIQLSQEHYEIIRESITKADRSRPLYHLAHTFKNMMGKPEIHNLFFERIHYLKNRAQTETELRDLEELESYLESDVQKEFSDEAPKWLRQLICNFGGKDELQ